MDKNNNSGNVSSSLLPIMVGAKELCREIIYLVRDSSKDLRHTYGTFLEDSTIHIVTSITAANTKKGEERFKILEELGVELSTFKEVLSIFCEVCNTNLNRVARLQSLLAEIGKQCTNWRKSSKP